MSTPISPPDPLRWHDAFLLGYTPMDAVHEEFVQRVAALQTAPEDQLPALLAALEQHLVEHFDEENRWMESTQFPPRECHINEHEAVLASVRQVRALAEAGDISECRRLADELAKWFPGHADYLDSALAHWMCKRSLGGKPVVIRRNLDLRPGEDAEPSTLSSSDRS